MANNQGAATSPATQEISKDQWPVFLADLTRENRGSHVRLEVVDSDGEYQVQVEDKQLEGVSADVRDEEHNVWITLAPRGTEHLTHGIQNVTSIRYRPAFGTAGAALEIVGREGQKALLLISPPGSYALP